MLVYQRVTTIPSHIGALQRRRIIDAISRHGHHLAAGHQRGHNGHLGHSGFAPYPAW